MSDTNLSSTTPQFGTAEYAETKSGQCTACKQPITGRYYSINNKIACENCMQQVAHRFPKDSHSAFVRGILFGVGAAIIGMILYATFTIATGLYIGYVSLAVGWLVGKPLCSALKGLAEGVTRLLL